jgi:hypothetical protein
LQLFSVSVTGVIDRKNGVGEFFSGELPDV